MGVRVGSNRTKPNLEFILGFDSVLFEPKTRTDWKSKTNQFCYLVWVYSNRMAKPIGFYIKKNIDTPTNPIDLISPNPKNP